MFEKFGAKAKLARNRFQAIAPFPFAEDIVGVLKTTEQLDGRPVVHVDPRAQQRPLEGPDGHLHVRGRHARSRIDEENRDTFHGRYVIARGDEVANRASTAVATVCAASTRRQPGMALAEKVTHGFIENFLTSEKAQRFHGWVP
jgi:hypothetical protein